MDDSMIICDEVIESYDEKLKHIPTNFNKKKVTCKTQSCYVLLGFLLFTIELLIAVSICYYLTKYQAKNVLPFHGPNNKLNRFCSPDNKLNKFCIDSIN